jgi:hypothetical protein
MLGTTSTMPHKPQYTAGAIQVINQARTLAHQRNAHFAGTEHLALATISRSSSQASSFLNNFLNLSELSTLLTHEVAQLSGSGSGGDYFDQYSPSLSRALELANQGWLLARTNGYQYQIGTEWLLFGLLLTKLKDQRNNVACMIIQKQISNKQHCSPSTVVWSLAESLFQAMGLTSLLTSFSEFLTLLPAEDTQRKYGWIWGPEIGRNLHPSSSSSSSKGSSTNNIVEQSAALVSGTHWVYPGKVLCGKSAGSMNSEQLKLMVTTLGVNTFVCLQKNYEEYGVNDYRQTLLSLQCNTRSNLRFLHCPVPDFGVLSGTSLVSFISELRRIMEESESILYVHCMGGHGRTGTVMTSLIASVENLSAYDALKRFRNLHFQRGCGHDCLHHGLEDSSQNEQVVQVQAAMKRQHKLN